MKLFVEFIIGTAFLIIMAFGIAFIDIKLDTKMLNRSGYEIIEYVNRSYKIYDRETKVVYIYSRDSHIFTVMYNPDGSLMLYNQ